MNSPPGPPGPAGDHGDAGMTGEFGQEGDEGDSGPQGEDGVPVRTSESYHLHSSVHSKLLSVSSDFNLPMSCRDTLDSLVGQVQKVKKGRRVWPHRKVEYIFHFIPFSISNNSCGPQNQQ